MVSCAECAGLTAKYEEATAARLKAEAELTAASFARDPGAIKIARGAVMAAVVGWNRARERLRQHQLSHVMRAGS